MTASSLSLLLRARTGERGRNVSYHRFVVTFEITVVAPGAGSEPASPADPAMTQDITNSIKRVKTKKNNKEYTVEQVKKVG